MTRNYAMQRLGYARKRAARYLPDVCVVKAKTTTFDDQGNPIDVYADKYPGREIRCRVRTPQLFSGVQLADQGIAGALLNKVLWQLELPYDLDVDPADQIEARGHTFELRGIRGPKTWEVTRHVDAVTVGEGEL